MNKITLYNCKKDENGNIFCNPCDKILDCTEIRMYHSAFKDISVEDAISKGSGFQTESGEVGIMCQFRNNMVIPYSNFWCDKELVADEVCVEKCY